MEDRRSQVDRRPQPPLTSGDSKHTYSQNVAGLWLKYGAAETDRDIDGADQVQQASPSGHRPEVLQK